MGIRCFIATIPLLLLCACPQSAGDAPADAPQASPARKQSTPRQLRVLCDPLLQDLLTALEPQLQEGLKGYDLQVMERGELFSRIEDGDSFEGFDAFAVADYECADALAEAGIISEATLRTFAGERLALICRKGESWRAESLFDIYRLRFKQLGIGSLQTSNGFYAEQALISDGVMPRVEDRLSKPDTAQAVLDDLLAKQTQLAIVPRSLITGHEEIKLMLLLGTDLHEDFVYRIAAAQGMESDGSVMALLTGLAEDDDIQALITGYGFDNREEAMGLNIPPE